MDKLKAKKPLYPMLCMLLSLATLIFGLIMATKDNIFMFYIAVYLLYLAFGYYKSCIAIIPGLAVTTFVIGGLTYLITKDLATTYHAFNRALAITFPAIPGLSVSTTHFVRNLRQLKVPKMITLGMLITLNFIPLFAKEMRQIKEAMKTRGVSLFLNFKVFYRAFILPLFVMILQISDTLSLSVETRGFVTDKVQTTIFEPIKFTARDIVFVMLFVACMVGGVLI